MRVSFCFVCLLVCCYRFSHEDPLGAVLGAGPVAAATVRARVVPRPLLRQEQDRAEQDALQLTKDPPQKKTKKN